MSRTRYTSIYLTKELKSQVIQTAMSEGFDVSRGRNSQLARFIEVLLQEHKLLLRSESVVTSLASLTPELRSAIFRLGEMDATRQKRANAMLELLLSDWQEKETRQNSNRGD